MIDVVILWFSNSKASLSSYYTRWWHFGSKSRIMPLWLDACRVSLSVLMVRISWFTRLYRSRKIQFAQYLKYTISAIDWYANGINWR